MQLEHSEVIITGNQYLSLNSCLTMKLQSNMQCVPRLSMRSLSNLLTFSTQIVVDCVTQPRYRELLQMSSPYFLNFFLEVQTTFCKQNKVNENKNITAYLTVISNTVKVHCNLHLLK